MRQLTTGRSALTNDQKSYQVRLRAQTRNARRLVVSIPRSHLRAARTSALIVGVCILLKVLLDEAYLHVTQLPGHRSSALPD